jgi:hypothetical protein
MAAPRAAGAAVAVPVASVTANALAYLVLLVAARTLDHVGYGSLAVRPTMPRASQRRAAVAG